MRRANVNLQSSHRTASRTDLFPFVGRLRRAVGIRSCGIFLSLGVVAAYASPNGAAGPNDPGTAASDCHGVRINWQSTDGTSRLMRATLCDGETFTGRFFEITPGTRLESLDGLWDGWHSRWYPLWRRLWREEEWRHWEARPEFLVHYQGRVLANLADARGRHLRCQFRLVRPPELAAGGSGRCQGPDRKTIDASLPAS